MLFKQKSLEQKPLPALPSLDLEPSLSEKMYHMLAQGPLGLVKVEDEGDTGSIDMMSILEEGPGERSERSEERSDKHNEEISANSVLITLPHLPQLSPLSVGPDPTPFETPFETPLMAQRSEELGEPFQTPRSSLWSDFHGSDESLPEKVAKVDTLSSVSDESDKSVTPATSRSDSDTETTKEATILEEPEETAPSATMSSPSLTSSPSLADSPPSKSLSSPNIMTSPPTLLESPLPLPRQNALASVLYVSQNPNAKSRSPATSRSTSPSKKHKRHSSSSSEQLSTNSMSFKSDSSDSDSHSVRSMRSFRSSFRSFSHDSLFALRKRDSVMLAPPLTPIFSNASTASPSHDIKALESALSKFHAKQGTPKANILRIELLTLLRKETPIGNQPSEAVNILAKWWKAVLEALHTRPSSHDKIAYMEAISKLMDRPEWKEHNSSQFNSLVYQTVRFCADKLSLKSVPVPLAAFSGKVLAYGFFHCPGVAHQLLAHLQVPPTDLERIGPICDSPVLKPPADGKPQIPLGPWIRRWASSVSDTFYSFLKHYYCISGGTEQDGELPPGWIHIHAFILGSLDAVVRPRKPPAPPSLTPCIPKPRKIHKLKLLGALRELKKSCHEDYFAHVLAPAIEDILKSVSLKTVVFDVEQCTALADLAEEMLTVLESPLRSLDAPFWLNVVGIMLRSESHYTTLRALAFLHNTFPEDPTSQSRYVDFILEADTLKKYFCHWHPLIRAAYMRVVCYRVLPKAPQKMNHSLVTVYTRLITYMEYCRVKESPLPVTDACSRLRIVSREFEATNVDLVVQNLQNLDFVDIGVRRRTSIVEEPATPPRNSSARSSPSVTPRYFEDSPPRVSAFDVEDDLFEGVEKHTVKKWGFIRKEVMTHDETHESGDRSSPSVTPNGISSQYKFVMESTSRSKNVSASSSESNEEPQVAYPRLPFDLKDKTKDSQSTLDSAVTVETSNTSMDDDAFRVPLDLNEFKDLTEYVKYWKYAGRALNEWDGVVREYETFVTQFGGNGVPHMVGDMGRCAPL